MRSRGKAVWDRTGLNGRNQSRIRKAVWCLGEDRECRGKGIKGVGQLCVGRWLVSVFGHALPRAACPGRTAAGVGLWPQGLVYPGKTESLNMAAAASHEVYLYFTCIFTDGLPSCPARDRSGLRLWLLS